jgi:hypothetical protein
MLRERASVWPKSKSFRKCLLREAARPPLARPSSWAKLLSKAREAKCQLATANLGDPLLLDQHPIQQPKASTRGAVPRPTSLRTEAPG